MDTLKGCVLVISGGFKRGRVTLSSYEQGGQANVINFLDCSCCLLRALPVFTLTHMLSLNKDAFLLKAVRRRIFKTFIPRSLH